MLYLINVQAVRGVLQLSRILKDFVPVGMFTIIRKKVYRVRVLVDKETAVSKAKAVAGEPFGAARIVKMLEDMPEVKRSYRLANEARIDRLIHTSFADSLELKMPVRADKEEPEIIPIPFISSAEIGDLGCMIERFAVKVVEQQEKIIMQAIRWIGNVKCSDITIDKGKVVEAFEKATPMKPTANYTCRRCGAQMINAQNYCSVCGQKVARSY